VIWHHLYRRLYYLPILWGAYLAGLRGGVIYAMVAALGYLPHIVFHWHHFSDKVDRLAEIGMYFIIGGLVGWMFDAIRRRNVALRRQERLALLGKMAAGVAHEVRNPLGGMRGAADILAGMKDMPAAAPEFTAIISNEITRLERVVADFVAFARPSPPIFNQLQLLDVVTATVKLVRNAETAKGMKITVNEPPMSLPLFMGDAQQLKQAFLNVLLNANRAMPDGGTVTIDISKRGEGLELIITDEGIGLGTSAVEQLFEPFQTTGEDGTGLGLSLARELVRAHGGELTLRNRNDRAGAIACFTFPVKNRGEI